jgi:acyl-coenzyme A thioesterase 13
MLPYGVEEALGGDDDDGKGSGTAGPSGRRPAAPPKGDNGDGDDAPLPPLERARLFLVAIASPEDGRFDSHAAPGLQAVSFVISKQSDNPTLRCTLPFSRAITNRYGGLHGGAAATLVDICSSAALAAVGDRPGVSLSITTHYHRPVVPLAGGEEEKTVIVVDSEVVKVGKQVAAVEVSIRTRLASGGGKAGQHQEGEDAFSCSGPVLVSGTHVKALVARSDVGALFEAARGRGKKAPPPRLRSRL